jgi:hypothetical protein
MKYVDLVPCVICQRKPSAIHHIKSRGSGGTDDWYNCIQLCMHHHQELHKIGAITFLNQYHDYGQILFARGWRIDGKKLFFDEDATDFEMNGEY